MKREPEEAPLVGVSWITLHEEKSRRYLEAVRMAGGRPVPMPADSNSWKAYLRSIRGLVLTGGGDINPRLYGEENIGLSQGINDARDNLELEALQHCLDRWLPVVAICRGFQLVNVAMGGSLVQDIFSSTEHRSIDGQSSFHMIEVTAGTRMATVTADQLRVRVNSRHHQGVDLQRVAKNLRATALAPDRVVEALELDGDQFLVAVQCHPEYLAQTPELNALFARFISAVHGDRLTGA